MSVDTIPTIPVTLSDLFQRNDTASDSDDQQASDSCVLGVLEPPRKRVMLHRPSESAGTRMSAQRISPATMSYRPWRQYTGP